MVRELEKKKTKSKDARCCPYVTTSFEPLQIKTRSTCDIIHLCLQKKKHKLSDLLIKHHEHPMPNTILCVAEKPSIAKAVANHLGQRVTTVRKITSDDALNAYSNTLLAQCAGCHIQQEL